VLEKAKGVEIEVPRSDYAFTFDLIGSVGMSKKLGERAPDMSRCVATGRWRWVQSRAKAKVAGDKEGVGLSPLQSNSPRGTQNVMTTYRSKVHLHSG